MSQRYLDLEIMKQKYGVIAIYDNGDVSKYFILVTMTTIHEIQVLHMFNIFNIIEPS